MNSGPVWHSLHAALPTNSRAPRSAAGPSVPGANPPAAQRSNGESREISVYSYAAIAFAKLT